MFQIIQKLLFEDGLFGSPSNTIVFEVFRIFPTYSELFEVLA